ncbi:MAG: MarR family winged helix-turn-helix transcriptional regulator [Candidatus Krumholzibacteriia bacterium]
MRETVAHRAQQAFLDVLQLQDRLLGEVSELCKAHGITEPQYNVLRILRGADDGLACQGIGSRMLRRVPDVTRLIDRLQTSGLVERDRSDEDRRVVVVRIRQQGLDLLARLDRPVVALHERQFEHLTTSEVHELSRLLTKLRESAERRGGAS